MTTYEEDEQFGAEFLEEIIEWIRKNIEPERIFDKSELEDWALNNGFVKE